MLLNWDNLSIIGPALIAGLLVLATHAPLGRMVLKRGIIFIDLAIAQIAGLGLIVTHQFIHEPPWWLGQVIALASAISGALLLNWTEKYWARIQEALIGIVFVLAATGGILVLSSNPEGGEHLQEILTGQILWVDSQQLIFTAIIYAMVLLLWYRLPRMRQGSGFYLLFAVSITLSVQMVGVYLVFSTLIIPAVAVSQMARNQLPIAYAAGACAYVAGLLVSLVTDLPSGPLIVMMMALSGMIFWNLFPHKHAVN